MKCEICDDGKDFKNLSAHVRTKHRISMDDYEEIIKTKTREKEEREEVLVQDVVEQKPDELAEILDKYKLSFDDLVDILDKHFEKNEISEEQQQELDKIHSFEDKAEEIARKMVGREKIDTNDLYIAEALSKKFGYKVIDVSSNPKTWHLKKG